MRPSLGYSNWYWIKKDQKELENKQKANALLLEQKTDLVVEEEVSEEIEQREQPVVATPQNLNTAPTITPPQNNPNLPMVRPNHNFGGNNGQ